MAKLTIRTLATFVWGIAACVCLHAQGGKTITVKLLDGRSGAAITPSNFVVRIDDQDAVHVEWVHVNDDGTAAVMLPADAKLVSVQATYDSSMETYINCDAAKEKTKYTAHWYAITDILMAGIVAPNECGKMKVLPKRGELTLFVRKRDLRDSPLD